MAIEFKDVARLLSCKEFAQGAGLRIQHKRAQCPFHSGVHFNLQFFDDGRCYCHVCHQTADVVQLAAAVWHMPQMDAAVELNTRFHLGLTGETVTPAERERREQARREAQEMRALIKQTEAQEWARACEAEQAARQALERFTIADADTPEFSQALRRLCAAQEHCNVLEAARRGGERA